MNLRVGSCHFVKCRYDENGRCTKGIDRGNGILIMCKEFEFEEYDLNE